MTDRPRIVRADPIPSDILDTLRKEGQEGWGVRDYPNRLAREYRQTQLAASLIHLAGLVEPVDRVLGIDREKPVAKAFQAGSMIGLRVVAACADDIDQALLDVAYVPSPEGAGTDSLHARQMFANHIVDMGDEAYAAVDGIFEPLFDGWEQLLIPDVRHQRYLRSGFGIPMSFLQARYDLNRSVDLAAMEAQVVSVEADGFDWDALLAQ